MTKLERSVGQRRQPGNQGYEHPGTEPRAASTSETTGTAGHILSPAHHLSKHRFQVDLTPRISVGRQEGSPDYHVVLWTMQMEERLILIFSKINAGSSEVSRRQSPRITSMPAVWQPLHT